MATSVVTLTGVRHYLSGEIYVLTGQVNVAAGDYAAGGLDVETLFEAHLHGHAAINTALWVDFQGQAGYLYEWDQATGKMQARQNKAPADAGAVDIPFPELAAAATPAALVADVIRFKAEYPRTSV